MSIKNILCPIKGAYDPGPAHLHKLQSGAYDPGPGPGTRVPGRDQKKELLAKPPWIRIQKVDLAQQYSATL